MVFGAAESCWNYTLRNPGVFGVGNDRILSQAGLRAGRQLCREDNLGEVGKE